MTALTPAQMEAAVAATADQLQENWRAAWRAQNGDVPRWKPLKQESVEWIQKHPDNVIPASDFHTTANGTQEIDIAALHNSQLPPQFADENTASAKSAIEAIQRNPNASIDDDAAIVHEQWLNRNGSWAPDELKVPYAQLSEAEEEKDRVVVKAVEEAIEKVSPESATMLGTIAAKVGRYGGLGGHAAGALIEGGTNGYQAYAHGGSPRQIASATGIGVAYGAVDTALPGARSGYADVIGRGNITWVDRALNAASDATTTVATGASVATAAGVETGPFDILPATVSFVAGASNVGVNVLKAGLKVTGLAGKNQDGGYIYGAGAFVGHLAEKGYAGVFGHNSHIAAHQPNRIALRAGPPPPSRTQAISHKHGMSSSMGL
ncbi:MAG: hypothetical protein WCD70_04595 [Alphaproteobacteria bacterium]